MSGKTLMWLGFSAVWIFAYGYTKGRVAEARKIKKLIDSFEVKKYQRYTPITEEEEQAFRQSHGDKKREA